MKVAHGFTIIEFVIVIVLVGILSAGTIVYINSAASIYVDTVRRDKLSSSGTVAAEKMARELRNSLPNNIRSIVSSPVGLYECIEFIPITAATYYTDVTLTSSVSSINTVPFSDTSVVDNGRVIVYPVDQNTVFANVAGTGVSADYGNQTNINGTTGAITLSTAHAFTGDSPLKRLYIANAPVSFCIEGTQLSRYSNYGWQATQPVPSALVSATKALVADNLSLSGSTIFTITNATLQSNALIEINLNMVDSMMPDENVRIDHEVYIRNVP